ncbi:DUF6348 family protein [Ruminococcus flavefaciens]|uniref:Uncharacterized protein n=1 Tax=Ruminococcus flavefaciens TaxID=1265 RepID=A0A315Y7P9_RUMFL|nr:DUF6348 family protein [Ruminococcus flavefaciens]PWJ15464.1 hypothetical protein IE37_00364 [Ruminococcus flavefaciens]SSA40634.1 hypothetical protein SAMN02910325_00364 [Ruminococcus flavefaciens]
MGLFKKKNNQKEEAAAAAASAADPRESIKKMVLDGLNAKLNGTLYDDCVIMPKGFTIDVQIGRLEETDGIKVLQTIFIVKHDDFDEPLIEPVDSQGTTDEEASNMAVEIFYGAVWHPIDQSCAKKNPQHLSINYLRQHYEFDMYCQSVVRIGVKDKEPTMLVNFIRNEIPKYIGSKKYYWLRIYLAKYKEKQIIEVRLNGSVLMELPQYFKEYVEKEMNGEDTFVSEKQYAIFVQTEDDQCPFKKDLVMSAAKETIEAMTKITSREEYMEMSKKLEELTEGNKDLAAEIRVFIPEILAKLTLGYREGDSLFLLEGEGDEQQSIEFKKTQLRSYFYLQQAILEYLSTRPSQEDVSRIVTNSVAFRELKKALDAAKADGKELKPEDLYVPGTSYKIGHEGYRVW